MQERTVAYATREEWLAARQHFIGPSEFAAVLGCSIFAARTPLSVWERRVGGGQAAPASGEYLEWGQRLEPVIIGKFADTHKSEHIEARELIVTHHAEFPVIAGTPDALAWSRETGELLYGIDAKTSRSELRSKWGREHTGEIPEDYRLQGLGYCAIFDVPAWHFAVLIGGNEYREYVIERDERREAEVIGSVLEWWDEHIVNKKMPEPDGRPTTAQLLTRIYGAPRPVMLPESEQASFHLKRIRFLDERMARDEEAATKSRNALRMLCADAEGIENVCTWKLRRGSSKTDWRALAMKLAAECQLAPDAFEEMVSDHTTTADDTRVLKLL